jgi:hypothetical protein
MERRRAVSAAIRRLVGDAQPATGGVHSVPLLEPTLLHSEIVNVNSRTEDVRARSGSGPGRTDAAPRRAVRERDKRDTVPIKSHAMPATCEYPLTGGRDKRDTVPIRMWPHAARERMRVARALVTLPETTTALARGALSYSAVRELTRVATPETEAAWLTATEGLVANQIECLVADHRPGDHPDDPADPDLRPRVVRLKLPPEVYALWRQARMVVATERGGEISDADFVETICRAAIAPGSGASGPAHQIAYQQCPDCRHATQNGAGREIDVGPEVLERASCDARVLGSLDAAAPERSTTTVTPRIREQVFARDHYRCTVPGCRSAETWKHITSSSRPAAASTSYGILACCAVATTVHFMQAC